MNLMKKLAGTDWGANMSVLRQGSAAKISLKRCIKYKTLGYG